MHPFCLNKKPLDQTKLSVPAMSHSALAVKWENVGAIRDVAKKLELAPRQNTCFAKTHVRDLSKILDIP